MECNKFYIDITIRLINARFKEHLTNKNNNSGLGTHFIIINTLLLYEQLHLSLKYIKDAYNILKKPSTRPTTHLLFVAIYILIKYLIHCLARALCNNNSKDYWKAVWQKWRRINGSKGLLKIKFAYNAETFRVMRMPLERWSATQIYDSESHCSTQLTFIEINYLQNSGNALKNDAKKKEWILHSKGQLLAKVIFY